MAAGDRRTDPTDGTSHDTDRRFARTIVWVQLGVPGSLLFEFVLLSMSHLVVERRR